MQVDIDDSVVVIAHKSGIFIFERTIMKNYYVVKFDITDSSDSQLALVIALDRFDYVDIVVNNKGDSGSFEELSDSQIGIKLKINFFGLINAMRITVKIIRD